MQMLSKQTSAMAQGHCPFVSLLQCSVEAQGSCHLGMQRLPFDVSARRTCMHSQARACMLGLALALAV